MGVAPRASSLDRDCRKVNVNMTPISLHGQTARSNFAYAQGDRSILSFEEEAVIRGFRVAVSSLILASAFVGLANTGAAIGQTRPPSATRAAPAPGIPNSAAGDRRQFGMTNKDGSSTSRGEREHVSGCAEERGAAAGKNGPDCSAASAAKGGNAPGGAGNADPAPRRRPQPCLGYPGRPCL